MYSITTRDWSVSAPPGQALDVLHAAELGAAGVHQLHYRAHERLGATMVTPRMGIPNFGDGVGLRQQGRVIHSHHQQPLVSSTIRRRRWAPLR